MPTYTQAFGGGATEIPGYGDLWQLGFAGTWAFNDNWTVEIAADTGNITLGVGFLHGLTPTVSFTYKNREYLGMGSQFNFSDNGDPTAWEEQNPGAGFVPYLSQYGSQDSIKAISQLQGRLVVLGRRSIQIWTVDADPNNFALVQTMDNLGTNGPLSVQNIGDYDVVFLADAGFRSARSREVTLNAFPDDLGVPIDDLVRPVIVGSAPTSCGIVEPTEISYWCFLDDTIYVLSRHNASKITAWTTFDPTYETLTAVTPTTNVSGTKAWTGLVVGAMYYLDLGNATQATNGVQTFNTSQYIVTTNATLVAIGTGSLTTTLSSLSMTTFVPQKFVVLNGQVFCRTEGRELIVYGTFFPGIDAEEDQYDTSQVTFQIGWLDDKRPATMKEAEGINAALAGAWVIKAGTDPISGDLLTVLTIGSPTQPDGPSDSVYDVGKIPFSSQGTHFSLQGVSSAISRKVAIMSSLIYHYNLGQNT